ncbi:MAG TPA: serpin family protein [Streptosporangiaceae bacterium]|nr:serpin family protein [Streptosporangiaceae bacterium]
MDDPPATRSGAADLAARAQAIDAAGVALYGALAAGGANTAFSPASTAVALQLALLGARGETAAELARFLHLSDPDAAAGGLRLLTAALTDSARSQDVTFRMPNTMWVQSGLPLTQEFTDRLRDLAALAVRDADFARAPMEAAREINQIIAAQTAGKIADLIAPGLISASTRLILANAVYLKARWAHPFAAGATTDGPFHTGGRAAVTASMMRVTAQLGYLRGGGYQAVVLPYAGSRLAMAVLLPDGAPGPLEEGLAERGVQGLTSGAGPTKVALTMPRFRVSTGFRLAGALRQLGVTAAFGGDADFSGITTAERLRIDEVVHKAYVDVDEQGTEAAAATAVTMRAAALVVPARPPVTVIVDRPFLFAIIDTATGTPLFLGKVSNPATA